MSFASIFPWLLSTFAVLNTWYAVHHGAPFWESFLLFLVFYHGGIQGLWSALGHLVFPSQTAQSIGWKSSGFQTEIGGANLAIGITGIMSSFNPSWIVPVGLVIAIFYSECIYIHLKDRIVNKNTAPCNSGPMLYDTILVTLSLYVCLIVIYVKSIYSLG